MQELKQALYDDLLTLADTLGDEDTAHDLCRALAENVWRKRESRGEVSLTNGEARHVVNDLRETAGFPALPLDSTTGSGRTGDAIEYALSSLGWRTDVRLPDRP